MKKNKIRVGITINFSIQFHANGLQQNIVFLKNLLDKLEDIDPYYIYKGDVPKENLIDKKNCISISDFIQKESNNFDLVILMGVCFDQNTLINIKNANKNLKFVFMQCGNQFIENSMRSVHFYEKVDYVNNFLIGIDEIWILPQHSQNLTYMKTFYRINSVKVVPCIWDSIFIDQQKKDLNFHEPENNYFCQNPKKIIILEPNLSIIKSCILPLYIVESFEREFPGVLSSCNIIGGKKIVESHYFIRLLLQMDIYQKRKNFLKASDRYKFCEVVKLFGSTIISHQIENDLNYLYFDALYLDIPLIHNSPKLKNYGYYYPRNDIDTAVNHLNYIVNNHNNNIAEYKARNKEVINTYSLNNQNNKEKYLKSIQNIVK